MFLQTNERLINLKNVSNINVVKDTNKKRFRIVFNLNYNIQIGHGSYAKFISDYVYWDSYNEADMIHNLIHLNENEFFKANFIDQINGEGYINKNEISSVKFSEKKNRVIFNLSHPVTFTDYHGADKITSEFVYVNCGSSDQYEEYVQYINQELGEK